MPGCQPVAQARAIERARHLRCARRVAANALGPAGGARGVEHRPARRAGGAAARRGGVAQRVPLRPRRARIGRRAAGCDRRDAWRHGRLQLAQQRRLGNEQLGAAVGEDVLQLVVLEVPVDRTPGGTQPTRRQHQLDHVRRVAQHQRHRVGRGDAQCLQRRSRAQHAVEQHVGFDRAAFEDQRGSHAVQAAAEAVSGLLECAAVAARRWTVRVEAAPARGTMSCMSHVRPLAQICCRAARARASSAVQR